jgi:hypothetical protein
MSQHATKLLHMQGFLRSLVPPFLRNVLRHGVPANEDRTDIRRDLGNVGRLGRRIDAVAVMTPGADPFSGPPPLPGAVGHAVVGSDEQMFGAE